MVFHQFKGEIGSGTAGRLVPSNTDRIKVIIKNVGVNTIFLGSGTSVGTSTGFPLPPNAVLSDTTSLTEWWGICIVGGTSIGLSEEHDLIGVN